MKEFYIYMMTNSIGWFTINSFLMRYPRWRAKREIKSWRREKKN